MTKHEAIAALADELGVEADAFVWDAAGDEAELAEDCDQPIGVSVDFGWRAHGFADVCATGGDCRMDLDAAPYASLGAVVHAMEMAMEQVLAACAKGDA